MGYTLMADLIAAGQEFGIFEFYLPWIIMFSIFWVLLSKTKLFGDSTKSDKPAKMARNVNLIISLAASMYIMADTSLGISFAAFLSTLFTGAFMIILSIIAFTTVLFVSYGVARGKDPFEGESPADEWKKLIKYVILAAILFALGVYITSSGAYIFPGIAMPSIPGFVFPSLPNIIFPAINFTSYDLAIFLMFAITGLIIWYVVK